MPIPITRIIVLLIALCAISAAQTSGSGQTKETLKDHWAEYKLPEHGFAALFPDKPAVTDVTGDDGDPSKGYQYMAFGETDVYAVLIREYPGDKTPGATEAFYAQQINDYAEGAHCVVQIRRSVTVAGQKASEAVIEKPANGSPIFWTF